MTLFFYSCTISVKSEKCIIESGNALDKTNSSDTTPGIFSDFVKLKIFLHIAHYKKQCHVQYDLGLKVALWTDTTFEPCSFPSNNTVKH